MPGAFYKNSASGGTSKSERSGRNEPPAANIRREKPEQFRPPVEAAPNAKAEQSAGARPEHAKPERLSLIRQDKSRQEKDSPDQPAPAKHRGWSWHARLTPSVMVMMSILLLVTLSFFFLFGLIVGRGMVPPSNPADLRRLITDSDQAAAPNAPERILAAEDLRFMTNLRSDAPESVGAQPNRPNAASHPTPPASAAAPAPAPTRTVPTGTQAVTQPPQSPAAPATPAPTQATAKFDFVLRVGAFKSEEQADTMRQKLEGAGMRTRLAREKAQVGTWYHVQVLFRGTAQDFQALRNRLPGLGIKDSMLASQKPVS